ncbi:MAG: 16S rRNA (adenine(1518)-N(6)/adenine(1519)-N(6))-dimethyltransferase RsmA [Phycisphaera sp.]|nr:MAG: 16S rRNA (adenine(1518)-N(6)/adenine(1519)-N(6))-dimethyltransferase RsmA [Phycisphaera sp.]
MQTLAEIKELLESRGLRPKRSLGQNFLTDQNLILKLVKACGIAVDSRVLEVGPGTGTLTEALVDTGAQVLSCELDDALAGLLQERLGDRENFTLIHGDCLEGKRALNPQIIEWLGAEPFRLVANLPYGCATPLMSTLLMHYPTCSILGVTIQKELGDRLLATPGNREYGPISVIARAVCDVEKIAHLPPACFWPRPQVDSSMLVLRRRPEPMCDPYALSTVCGALFQQRRKRIAKPLRELLGDREPPEGVSPDMRAEEVSLQAFCRLASAIDHE